MSKKLEAKNALIEVPLSSKQGDIKRDQIPSGRTRTAVGGMAQFVITQSPVHQEAAELREKIKEFDGADVVKAIDPAVIAPSEWGNRHCDSFESSEFAAFKREIMEAGGNVQPIKVRPVDSSRRSTQDGIKFEIVFGHRRHRACLELRMPVKALIEDLGDQELFVQMDRENRGRKNLSAWEQGCMYLTAMEKKLYPSLRKLAEAIGVDVSIVSKSVALAKLPKPVIDAFPSPLDIQFRWAQPLGEVLQRDHDGLIERAQAVRAAPEDGLRSATEIFTLLIGTIKSEAGTTSQREIRKHGMRVGQVSTSPKGDMLLKLAAGTMSPDRQEAFVRLVEEFLSKE